jgi:hypothetical protein
MVADAYAKAYGINNDGSPNRVITRLCDQLEECNTVIATLRAEVAALKDHRDRELRERFILSALQGAARDSHMLHEASNMGARAVYMADSALAAMRKGDGNG